MEWGGQQILFPKSNEGSRDGWETFLSPGPPVRPVEVRFITRITRPTSENGGKVKSEEGVCSEVTVYALSEDKKFLAEGKNLAHRSFSQTSPCAQKASNGLLIEKSDNKLQSDSHLLPPGWTGCSGLWLERPREHIPGLQGRMKMLEF